MASSLPEVAEVTYSTCFGFKARWQKPTLPVLDEASAGARVQQDGESLLWVDLKAQAVCLTECWEDGPVHQQLPAKIAVDRHEAADVCEVDEEVSVATITFTGRGAAELFGALAFHVLPEWRSIRRSVAGKSLLVLADHWLVTEDEQALKLEHPDGHISFMLRLNTSRGSIEVEVMQDGQACRRYSVGCFDDVSKLLKKHSKPRQRLDKTVHAMLKELRPSTSSVTCLLAKLEAAVKQLKGVPSMAQWCRGGIMAALVDCAASLAGSSSGGSGQSQQRQSTGGFNAFSQDHKSRSRSMPGAAPSQQAKSSSSSSARLQTIQALSECCAVVLHLAADEALQAKLLVDCAHRALAGPMDQAVAVLQLLRMLLRQVGAQHEGAASGSALPAQLRQACCNLRLLHRLQNWYSATVPPLQLSSYQLEGLSADDAASEPSTPSGYQASASALQGAAAGQGPAVQPDSCPDSPQAQQPGSSPCPPPVPRLHLPVPVTPAPSSASRLSCSARAPASSSRSFTVADKATPSGREVASSSFVKALQQLGYSCGQSMMAADLAAFVTHKQLLGGVLASEATLQHNKAAGDSTQAGGGNGSVPGQGRLSFEQLARLPVCAQLQLELLELLVLLAEAPTGALVLPRSWECLLLSPLLVPAASWPQPGCAVSGRALVEQAHGQMRSRTLQLIQACSSVWHMCLPGGGSAPGVAQQGASLHHPVLQQFKLQLVAASDLAKSGACTHGVCAQLLLLLVDYLRIAQRTKLADTACFMLGGVLAQQEHMLRSTRAEHWPWEAVEHMDALVQLYAQLLGQVTCPANATWLLSVLGVPMSSSRPGPGLSLFGSGSACVNSPGARTPAAADTLQLVLDFVQTYLGQLGAAADSLGSKARAAAAAVASQAADATDSSGLSASVEAALQQCGSNAGVRVSEFKAHCWVLLSRLLQLASHQPAFRVAEPLMSPLPPRAPSISAMQHHAEAGGSRTPGALASPKCTAGPVTRLHPDGGGVSSSATPRTAVLPDLPSPASGRRPTLPLLSFSNSGTSRSPSASALAPLTGNRQEGFAGVGQMPGHAGVSGDGSAPGRCSVWQLLVELLMVNSSMGQATVLQHIDATHNHKLLPCLQQAVVGFLSTALGMPDSYPFSKPQLAEFYVHHHFLYFTQHYHKLPSSGSVAAALCKSHLQVLLALCHQTSGANQVRRRFLQLKVLEFLAREASLEYMCIHNQLAISPGSSTCSTPLSTSRTATSCRASARGTTDPGTAPAGAGGSPGLALGTVLASGAAGWEGSTHSARGPASSRLWSSSPGCQTSARSARSTQRSWSTKALCPAPEESHRSGSAGPLAAAQQPVSFELETFRAAGADHLLTGSSGLLTGSSALLTGASSLFTTGSALGARSSSNSNSSGPHASSSGGADFRRQQQLPRLGSNVQAAVQVFEAKASESAAAVPKLLPRPQPPKTAAPAAGPGGRRQPGHRRLVCAVDQAEAAPAAAKGSGVGAAAGTAADQASLSDSQQQAPSALRPAGQLQEQQEPSPQEAASGSRQVAAPPRIPVLKLPGFSPASTGCDGQSSRREPITHSGRLAWQPLERPQGNAAPGAGLPAAASPRSACSSSNPSSSSRSSSECALSPRQDIAGFELPASVRSQRRVKQPQLTGDASLDNIIIDDWERETGLEFQFDGLSDDEGASSASGSDNGSSSSCSSTPRTGDPSSSRACQAAAADQAKAGPAGPQAPLWLQGLDTVALPQLPEAAALDTAWALPQLGLGAPGRPGRWLSSSDSVEDAPAADLVEILGAQQPGLLAAAPGDAAGHTTVVLAADDDGAACTSSSGAGTAPGKAQVPKLQMGALNGTAATMPSAAGAGGGGAAAAEAAQPPSSYRQGYDIEDDFERQCERFEATGHWGDSDCSESCSEAGASPGRQEEQPQSPPLRQQVRQLQLQQRQPVPALQLPWQQQPSTEQQQDAASPQHQALSSADTQAHADVQTAKRKSPSKKQVVMAGAGLPVSAELLAHALADCDATSSSNSSSSSEGEEEVCSGSSGDEVLDTGRDGACAGSGSPRLTPHQAASAAAAAGHAQLARVPPLNMNQVLQGSWHLPMSEAPPASRDSSEAGFSTSTSTRMTTVGSRASIAVMPLATSRLSCGGGDSSRSRSHTLAGAGPGSARLAAAPAQRLPAGWSPGLFPAAAAGPAGGPCTPYGMSCGFDVPQGLYAVHRAKCGLYMDPELHVLCLELALHLLVTPTGRLDSVQLPHEPSDVSLQRKVLLLLEHLSHGDNLEVTCCLAQRACDTLRQHQQQQQCRCPLPLTGGSSGAGNSSSDDSRQGLWQQQQPGQTCDVTHQVSGMDGLAVCSSGSRQAVTSARHRLRSACSVVWHPSTLPRTANSAGGGSRLGSSSAATAAADAAAGLAGSTLRLLKLLSLPVLDMSSLAVGGMINKGAFSEVFSGTLQQAAGGAPLPVALKVMDCNEDDACSFERVYNEVASLDALRGQASVVPLLEYGVSSSISGTRQWVLVFPKYAGSMREWRLRWRGKGLDTQDLPVYLRLFIQVAQAVALLHASNIVHFDLKGDNVLLEEGFDPAAAPSGGTRSSSSTSSAMAGLSSRQDASLSSSRSHGSCSSSSSPLVLADFGDALMLENAHASSQRHRGTELFSSPEMLLLHAGRQHAQHAQHDRRKHRGVHAAHDVWSLGCTLYELLTGTVLFEEEGVGRITSYSSSQSSGGGGNGLHSDGRGWGVLNAREKAALQHHAGCIELVESMLVGEPNWRPTAEQVVIKAQRLLAAESSAP